MPVPGDKSITHRALFFGALNRKRTTIVNPSTAEDVGRTVELLRGLGYRIIQEEGCWIVGGAERGVAPKEATFDCGNSGTTARLALGFLCGEEGRFTLTGDASLSCRPMERIAEPLRALGVDVRTETGTLPVTVIAKDGLHGTCGEILNVSSAQVHGALTLAALRSEEGVILRRMRPMRDHTIRMLHAFRAPAAAGLMEDIDRVRPARFDRDIEIRVPGDVSSAAFTIAAAILKPEASVTLHNVGLNPTRIGFLRVLKTMGAEIDWRVEQDEVEPVGTIEARWSPALHGISLNGDAVEGMSVSEMMDELPLLALVAARARGETVIQGAAELRVKESDRIAGTCELLRTMGIEIEELKDGFRITGPQEVSGGARINTYGDHRLCMIAGVAGLIAAEPIDIPHPDIVAVSYPDFWKDIRSLRESADVSH